MSIARAKSLRSNATKSEQALWDLLRRRQQWGLRFRRQHPVGPFVADFVCLERRVIVEVDGTVHDHVNRITHDIERDAWLSDQHFKVVRIPAHVVESDPERALALVAAALGPETVDGVHTPHPRPFPRKGGREGASSQSVSSQRLSVSKEQTS